VPDDVDTRKRLARLLVEVERFADAEQQAKWLMARDGDDLTALRLMAAAQLKQLGADVRVSPADVVKTHLAALEKHPGDVELSVALAELYRERSDALIGLTPREAATAADAIIDKMAAVNADNYRALLARFHYRTRYKLPGAQDDLQAALAAGPDVPDVLLAAIEHNWRNGRLDEALSLSDRVLTAAPTDRRGYLAKGESHLRLGNRKQALDVWQQGLKLVGADDLDFNRAIFRLKLEEGQFVEADETLGTIESSLRRLGPFLTAVTRRRLAEELEVFRAQLLIARGDARTAIPVLKRISAGHTQDSNLELDAAAREQHWTLLAQAQAALLRFDLAAEAAEQAAKASPQSAAAGLLAAAAWQRAGQTDDAIRHYQALLKAEKPSKEAVIGFARLLLRQELGRAEGSRDWEQFEQLMTRAKTLFGQDSALQLIEAEAALGRSDRDGGMALLDALLAQPAIDSRSIVGAALMYEAAGDSTRADRAVEQLAARPQDELQSALLRAEILARRGEFDSARQVLTQVQESVSPGVRSAVTRRLADLDVQCGEPQVARQRLRELSKSHPKDVALLEAVANLAYQAGDLQELLSCENRLREVEGSAGTSWKYFQGLRLVAAARSSSDPLLTQAEQLRTQIEQARSDWPGGRVLSGRIADRRNQTEQAVNDYQEAIRRGDRSLSTVEALVGGLYRLGRFTEAGRYLAQTPQFVALSPVLTDAAIPAYMRSGRTDQAEAIATAAVRSRPNDPTAQVWLGQSLAIANRLPVADG
jgi:tetratricopeptide (TPR) repeat protein